MMSQTEFRFIDRGHEKPLVLIPGWAFDWRIFEPLDLDYNYLSPAKTDFYTFKDDLLRVVLEKGIEKISLFGWSMGGFIALDFLTVYPDLVDEIFLVSMRKRLPKEQINLQKNLLRKDKDNYLSQFYRNCFVGQKEDFGWFKKKLLDSYFKDFSLNYLVEGLDYLSNKELDIRSWGKYKLKIFHSKKDNIAPFKDITIVKKDLPSLSLIIFEDSGHLPFLHPDFRREFYGI